MSQRYWDKYAGMAELADALDLGSSAARRVGSSPTSRTICSHSTIGRGAAPQEHEMWVQIPLGVCDSFLVGYGQSFRIKYR